MSSCGKAHCRNVVQSASRMAGTDTPKTSFRARAMNVAVIQNQSKAVTGDTRLNAALSPELADHVTDPPRTTGHDLAAAVSENGVSDLLGFAAVELGSDRGVPDHGSTTSADDRAVDRRAVTYVHIITRAPPRSTITELRRRCWRERASISPRVPRKMTASCRALMSNPPLNSVRTVSRTGSEFDPRYSWCPRSLSAVPRAGRSGCGQ